MNAEKKPNETNQKDVVDLIPTENQNNLYMKENWIKVGKTTDIPSEGGACVKINDTQIAVFNFSSRGEWYATQNLCPHRKEMILSRGMIGDKSGEPKVACPFHKRNFSLVDGKCLSGDDYIIKTYPVKLEGDEVYVNVGG